MKKFLTAAAIIVGLFTVSYTVANSINAKGVVAQAGCDKENCD